MSCQRGFQKVDSVAQCEQGGLRAHGRPFAFAGTPRQFAPDTPVVFRDLTLAVAVDLRGRAIAGTATYTLEAASERVPELVLDAREMDILRVFDGSGLPLRFSHDGRRLTIRFGASLGRGEPARVAIDFRVQAPRAGFYFILPDAEHPDRVPQAWTQGQDEDSHFWFPCHDSPNARTPVRVLATVPEGNVALSNGRLIEVHDGPEAGTRLFDWRLAEPTATYLVTLVVGPFAEVKQGEVGGVPVAYWVLPGREADGERAFGRTPEMIRFFEDLLGVRYPWEKYAQVAVSEFVFGGMENTSMTTQTDATLHDARAHLDFSSDPLVSHELAHQWFGDLVTCRTWSHAWLNEGFATYFELLWREHALGKDDFDLARLDYADQYRTEDGDRYRRPIVTDRWDEPIDLFDRHLYEKGALVLHMLRREIGDTAFFGGLRRYLERHRGGTVDTHDLQRALEEWTGKSLGRFFAQWVHAAGHPALKARYAWSEEDRLATITLEQTQPVAEGEEPFHLSVGVSFELPTGQVVERVVTMTQKAQRLVVPLDQEPLLARVDPDADLLRTLEFERPSAMLRRALREDPSVPARIEAAQAMGKDPSPHNLDALGLALRSDPFWGVRAAAAKVIGKIGTDRGLGALEAALGDEHPKARRAVVEALGELRSEAAAQLLAAALDRGDASWLVEAEFARSLGKTRQAGIAFEPLVAALDRPSWNEVIRVGALDGLGALRDVRGIDVAQAWCTADRSVLARVAALRCLGRFTGESRRVLDFLETLRDDGSFRVVIALIGACETLGDPRATGLVAEVGDRAVDGRVKRRCREVQRVLAELREPGKAAQAVREELEALREAHRGLLSRVDTLERGGREV